jgi:hypothetical protein
MNEERKSGHETFAVFIIALTIIIVSITAVYLASKFDNTAVYGGVIKDYKYNPYTWGNPEKMVFLFEDDSSLTITADSEEYSLGALSLIAKNNIGKYIQLTCDANYGNCVENLEVI